MGEKRDAKRQADYQREYLKKPANRKRHNAARREFYKRNKAKERADSLAYYRANRERLNQAAKDRNLFRNYGLTRDGFNYMLRRQGGRCANLGCRTKSPGGHGQFHVDHCHKTKRIRGLLCHGCNVGLGAFHDDEKRIAGALSYLTARR